MMNSDFNSTDGADPSAWSGGLSDLSAVILDPPRQEMLDGMAGRCGGNAAWKRRKLHDFREFLALSQVSGRVNLMHADLSIALRLLFALKVPVPTMPGPDGDLVVAGHAMIGLTYEEVAIRLPQPGYAFVGILSPNHVWHPNVAASDPAFAGIGPGQPLCLGAELAAGTPVKELVIQTFSALALQSIQLDERDPAGILNLQAARWYLQNRARIPLTSEGFLDPNPSAAIH